MRTYTDESSPLLSITPGPTQVKVSSASSAWSGLLLEKHLTFPGVRPSVFASKHVISLLTGPSSRFEYRDSSDRVISCLQRTGSLTLTPVGPMPEMRLHTCAEQLHCALEASFVRGVINEMESESPRIPTFRAGIEDKSINRILNMLLEELETERPLGRLFVDSLAHALATRYLLIDCVSASASQGGVSSLPTRILNRVREKMEANLDSDLSLASLADESGYSRAHFLRMFRAATGLTPHQYVLNLRLSRAQEFLRKKDANIIDIAVSCGFSSQSHMTSVFRQRLEITPAEFRRSAKVNIACECVA